MSFQKKEVKATCGLTPGHPENAKNKENAEAFYQFHVLSDKLR